MQYVDITPDDTTLRYWVADGEEYPSEPAGRREFRELACEKVAGAILNFVIGHCWNPAQSGRWTHVTQGLKRVALLFVSKDILGQAVALAGRLAHRFFGEDCRAEQ